MKVDRQIFIKQKLFQFCPHVMEKILLGVTGARAEMLFCPNGAKSFSPALTDEIGLRWDGRWNNEQLRRSCIRAEME
jgi:hypothetical protein